MEHTVALGLAVVVGLVLAALIIGQSTHRAQIDRHERVIGALGGMVQQLGRRLDTVADAVADQQRALNRPDQIDGA